MTTIRETTEAVKTVRPFIAPTQIEIMGDACRGEEHEFFKDKFVEMADLVTNMPKTYEQDGKGDQAIVYLHYFLGSADWYITEKDKGDGEDTRQIQAFGYADLGYGGELGYISIEELIENSVELDLHWTPKTLAEVKAS